MTFDYEFIKNIILVAIPAGLAIITSKWVASSWQIRNEKTKIKMQILTEFYKSVKMRSQLLDSFFDEVNEEYYQYDSKLENGVEIDIGKSSQKSDNFKVILKYPTDVNEQPFKKFNEKRRKLQVDLSAAYFEGSLFLSDLRLFYRKEELEKEYRIMTDKMRHNLRVLDKLIRSKDQDEYEKFYSIYLGNSDEIVSNIKQFELKLVDTELYKLTI